MKAMFEQFKIKVCLVNPNQGEQRVDRWWWHGGLGCVGCSQEEWADGCWDHRTNSRTQAWPTRITEPNCRGWKEHLEIIQSNPLLKQVPNPAAIPVNSP